MAIPITIPRLGWNMEEGTFAGWLKQDGDAVQPGDRLFTLESEKATEEIECLDGGILRLLPDSPRSGEKLAVGAIIGYLVAAGEALPVSEKPDIPRALAAAVAKPAVIEAAVPRRDPQLERTISPRARRVAFELGVDWSRLSGSGRGGRIRERDVRGARLLAGEALNPIRRAIAEHMTASMRATAPVTLTTAADATHLMEFRARRQADGGAAVASITAIMIKLAAGALQRHPRLNAVWSGDRLAVIKDIHMGVAVDTDHGLLAPVLRMVHTLSLMEIDKQVRDLAERARQKRLKLQDMEGGTFTVTNLGAFGIDAFTPIIHYPQCAILGIGRIQRQPVVRDNQIVVGERITLSLTFDHRALDGAPAARFLQTFSELIEAAPASLESKTC